MTFKRFCFFLRAAFFFPSPQTIVSGAGEGVPSPPPAPPPQPVKDCVCRVRKQYTKVRECKNSGTQGTARGRGSARKFPPVDFSQRLLRPQGRNSGTGRAASVLRAQTFATPMQLGGGVLNLGCVGYVPTASRTSPYPRPPHPTSQKRRPRFSVEEVPAPPPTASWREPGSDLWAISVQTLPGCIRSDLVLCSQLPGLPTHVPLVMRPH